VVCVRYRKHAESRRPDLGRIGNANDSFKKNRVDVIVKKRMWDIQSG